METVRGPFPEEIEKVEDLVDKMGNIGFQAAELYRAVKMLEEMLSDDSYTLYLGFTSNVISSGMRELVAAMLREGWFHVVVTTIGAVEEDVMKTLGDFKVGDWYVDDVELRKRGINRIGNIFVENKLYERLEDFLDPIFDTIEGRVSSWEFVKLLGNRIKDERSFIYWAVKNNIPVVVPAPTDGAIGLMLYYYREKTNRDIGIDPTLDMELLSSITFDAKKTGALIIGGGVPKHHIIGMNIVRGGLDKAVYITTATEWDGSLSGAQPREAKSWGKIKERGNSVTVYAEASLVLPLMVRYLWSRLQ